MSIETFQSSFIHYVNINIVGIAINFIDYNKF